MLAAEYMEAGRSILRGLVTPDRTVLIASTHRALAVVEKATPGNGIADSNVVFEAAGIAVKRVIGFDMQKEAEASGTMISAPLFGALAASGVLPFERGAYEAAIRAGGKGAAPSLAGFARGFERATGAPLEAAEFEPAPKMLPPTHAAHDPATEALLERVVRELPEPAWAFARAGVARLIDYQDVAYAGEYLDRLGSLLALDHRSGGPEKMSALTAAAAKHLAVALTYDDILRVADLKTRESRFDRVRREVGAADGQLVYMTEFMHPRVEELLGTLPRRLGHALEARPNLLSRLDKVINRGRRVRTGTVFWFLVLYGIAGLRRFRRAFLRHEREMAHVAHWLVVVCETAPRDYDLAVEALSCRRLVKGYSDTHARGMSKFDRVLAEVSFLTARPDSAGWLRRLKEAALADEKGDALNGAMQTMRSAYT